MISFLLLGFMLGMRHALEADHVAAVATLASRSRTTAQALLHGALWGLGHTITLFLACSILLFVDSVVPERLAQLLEAAVGAMLILLGVDLLRRMLRERMHFHTHRHSDGTLHFHVHSHAACESPHACDGRALHSHSHGEKFSARALYIGLVHGLAGSAALILLALDPEISPLLGLLYVALFGLGSIGGMALLSLAISVPLRRACRFTRLHSFVQLTLGLVTAYLGSSLLYQNVHL